MDLKNINRTDQCKMQTADCYKLRGLNVCVLLADN